MIADRYFAELSDAEDGVAFYFDNELIDRLGVVAMLAVKQGFRGVHSWKVYLGT